MKFGKQFRGWCFQDLSISGPDNQDVTGLEFDALVLGHLLDVFGRDAVTVERVVRLARRLLMVPFPINKDATSDDSTTRVPVINGWQRVLGGGLHGKALFSWFQSVVCGTVRCDVTQTVPLTAKLRVELELVVPTFTVHTQISEAMGPVNWRLATREWKLDTIQRPAVSCQVSLGRQRLMRVGQYTLT